MNDQNCVLQKWCLGSYFFRKVFISSSFDYSSQTYKFVDSIVQKKLTLQCRPLNWNWTNFSTYIGRKFKLFLREKLLDINNLLDILFQINSSNIFMYGSINNIKELIPQKSDFIIEERECDSTSLSKKV